MTARRARTQSESQKNAQKLVTDFSLHTAPIAVEDVARRLGISIVRTPFKGTESGFAMRDGATRVIGVNSLTSRRRQRFTIAHELGHLLMHEGKLIVDHSIRVNWRDDTSSLGTDEQEIEANAFAAELLMPPELVYKLTSEVAKDRTDREALVADLARKFDVSAEAMGFRLINLGIFP